jgi:hypothetical protein
MKQRFVVLGFVMCFFGLALGFVYFNPFGFVLDALGFMIFLYGLFARESYEQDSVDIARALAEDEERNKCHNCLLFGKEFCPRAEKYYNAKPCDKFEFYSGKRNS